MSDVSRLEEITDLGKLLYVAMPQELERNISYADQGDDLLQIYPIEGFIVRNRSLTSVISNAFIPWQRWPSLSWPLSRCIIYYRCIIHSCVFVVVFFNLALFFFLSPV